MGNSIRVSDSTSPKENQALQSFVATSSIESTETKDTLESLSRKLHSSDVLKEMRSSGSIWSFAFTPDSKYLAAGSDVDVVIYDASTLECEFTIQREGTTRSVAYSPNGQYLAIGGDDQILAIYDAKEYTQVYKATPNTLAGAIRALAYSPDGKHIVFGGKGNEIVLFDAVTHCIVKKALKKSTVWTLTYSPDGKYIAEAGHDRKIAIHKSDTLEVVSEFERGSAIKSLAYSPDGSILVAGYTDHVVEAYDASTFAIINSLKRGGPVECVTFCIDGTAILVGGWDAKIALYDTSTFDLLHEYARSNTIWAITCSVDGETFVAGGDDHQIKIYDTTPNTIFCQLERKGNARAVSYSPNGRYFAVGGHDNILSVYRTSSLSCVMDLQRNDTIRAIAFSYCGKKLAVGGEDNKVTIYDTSKFDLEEIHILSEMNMKGSIFTLDFSPDGTRLAIGGSENKVIFLNSIDLTVVNEIQREGWVRVICYSSDGRYVAAGGDDKKVTVYNTVTSTKIHEYERAGWVFALAFSPDNTCLAVGGNDKKLTTHDFKHNFVNEYEANEIAALAYSPDGQYLAVAGNGKAMRLLNVRDGFRAFINPILLSQSVSSLAFYPSRGQTGFQTLIIASGPLLTSIKLRSFSTTPVEILLRNNNDSELINMIREYNLPAHQQVNLISASSNDKSRTALMAKIISRNPSYALLAMENTKTREILSILEEHHRLNELNLIALSSAFHSLTSERNLHEMLFVVLKLARKQFRSSVVNFLNARENGSLPGFIHVKDAYLLKETSKNAFLPNQMQSSEGDISPLSKSLPPRAINTTNVLDVWKDLLEDKEKQIKVRILRGLIPDLGSFESLKAFTQMNDNEPFETHALRTAIDCHWTSWARSRFRIQAIIYFISLVSFVGFCDLTVKDNKASDEIIYLLASITMLGMLFFAYRELKQYTGLQGRYFRDAWNGIQWITMSLTLSSIVLRLSGNQNRTSAVVSSLALLFGWFGILFYLRGIEDCAWITTALYRIAIRMVSFMIVLLTVLIGFALFFQNLFKHEDNFPGSEAEDPVEKYFEFRGFGYSIVSMFNAGVLGNFEIEPLLKTSAPDFAVVMMIILFLVVTLLALNALIAFISTAFEDVLAEKLAVLKKQKALIILDLYSVLSEGERKKIEERNKWTTIIVPAERLQLDDKGITENQAKATKGDVIKLSSALDLIQKEITHINQDEKASHLENELSKLKSEVEGIKDDVKAILKAVRQS